MRDDANVHLKGPDDLKRPANLEIDNCSVLRVLDSHSAVFSVALLDAGVD